ncbi:hypothetical protein CVM73_18420 [Bradyrhizobium forestalis]|uniref:Uncharacterized protein n=1 Tax=Bradyrhizobium forestalis TaxID=1419263 RepID=A0A2M8R7B5_9BRAD|nr:hypothetical protein CVM73_18420 [Bradyrhizobium forestalis]
MEVRYATCGELVGEMATRCVDEVPIVSVTSAAGTLEHVSRILVMRSHCGSLRLFTEPGDADHATVV